MGIRSVKDIYQKIEKHLRVAKGPMTCVDLMDISEVRETAIKDLGGGERDIKRVTEKVSDTLGFMWRKGLIIRYPAPRTSTSLARYSYIWDHRQDNAAPPKTITSTVSRKQGFIVREEEDGVIIEFEKFMVYIKQK